MHARLENDFIIFVVIFDIKANSYFWTILFFYENDIWYIFDFYVLILCENLLNYYNWCLVIKSFEIILQKHNWILRIVSLLLNPYWCKNYIN